MNNEEKILQMLSDLTNDVKGIRSGVNSLKSDVKDIKSDIKDLKEGQFEIKTLLDEFEPKNERRHSEMLVKIDNLSKDLAIMEAVAGKNMTDIAHLKLIK